MAHIAVWKVIENGTVKISPQTLPRAATSLNQSSELLPGGAYTTFRTFPPDRVVQFHRHVMRLEETARLAAKPVKIDETDLRIAVRQAISDFPGGEKRIRLTLDLEQQPGTIYIQIEPLKVPSSRDYREGVKVVTSRMERNNPKAKLTAFIETADCIRQELPPGVNEVLMVDDRGFILEGLTSNFFAVRNGELWTEEKRALSGITRAMILEEAANIGISVQMEGVTIEELSSIDEAFISSSSRAVLPISSIDGQKIGSGKPGPVTKRLMDCYQRRIELETEPL